MTNKVYQGDTGTAIILDCVEDISSATEATIEARRPDGSLVSWPAVVDSDTTVRFVTEADSLNMAGRWKLQPRVTLTSGVWRGETKIMTVYRHFS